MLEVRIGDRGSGGRLVDEMVYSHPPYKMSLQQKEILGFERGRVSLYTSCGRDRYSPVSYKLCKIASWLAVRERKGIDIVNNELSLVNCISTGYNCSGYAFRFLEVGVLALPVIKGCLVCEIRW